MDINPRLVKRLSRSKCKVGENARYFPDVLTKVDGLDVGQEVVVMGFDPTQKKKFAIVEVSKRYSGGSETFKVLLSDLAVS